MVNPRRKAVKPSSTATTKHKPSSTKRVPKDTLGVTKNAKAYPDGENAKNPKELIRFVEDLKRQWMSTIDALVDPLMIVGSDFKIRKANIALARLQGLDVRNVVGMKCHEVFAGRKSPCTGCKLNNSVKGQTATTFSLNDIRGDRHYEVASQPLFNLEGKLDGIVHVYRDRTDAMRMQEQLSQQEKLASIGLLAGGVAHEINNPLGGILIFSQMLLREVPQDSPHYQDVVEIEAATQRCKAIVESLLDFARQNPQDQKAPPESIPVLDAIRTAIRFAKVQGKPNTQVTIEERFDAGEHLLAYDRHRIVQLFLNLIQNALQAMPDGGSLVIRAHQESIGDTTVGYYEIEDSGVGIPPEHLKKIFDPFFTTKDPGEGTGLGLALCYGIVQDLKGKLTVESTINVGTRFILEFPLAQTTRMESAS